LLDLAFYLWMKLPDSFGRILGIACPIPFH
jgi:hypothetical protein